MGKELTYINWIFAIYAIGITLLLIVFLGYKVTDEYASANKYALAEAQASHNKDLLYRRWATIHGGVYVSVTDETPPNPYLTYVSERDITTPKGVKLTLINPAYMTRQVHELSEKQYGVKGHITSLNPIRPENKPDEWETKVLKMFEGKYREYFDIINNDSIKELRYMRAMITEKKCLKCHEHQGYKEGDVRGGISVAVPLDKYYNVAKTYSYKDTIIYSSIYLIVIFFSFIGYRKLTNEVKQTQLLNNQLQINKIELIKKNEDLLLINQKISTLNAELIEAKEKAEASHKLKTAFLQNISHEIRTPLNAIVGFSNQLGHSNLSQDEKLMFINIIQKNSEQLAQVVSDIVIASALETNQVEIHLTEFNIYELINEIYTTRLRDTNNKNLIFVKNIPNDCKNIKIFTDKTKLSQIFNNLLSNSIKYTEKGTIELGALLLDGEMQFYVKDTGIGIDNAEIDKIFERFYQSPQIDNVKFGGNGLGLTIVKSFVEVLGGRIWVESKINVGSVFYLSFNLNDNQNFKLLTTKM